MEDKNCELLFEYLRSILYDPSPEKLDISQLEPQFQKLGKGFRYLDKAVREMKEYSAALSKGILSGFYPGRDNFLCENLKNLACESESFNMAGKAGCKWGLFADSLLSWGIFGCIQYND